MLLIFFVCCIWFKFFSVHFDTNFAGFLRFVQQFRIHCCCFNLCCRRSLGLYSTHTHTQTFNSLFSRTTWVGRYQKGKPFWILLKQQMMGWQWHQLNHMQIICTSLQTDNHASTSSLHIFYRPDALPAAQPTASKQWRYISKTVHDKYIAQWSRLLNWPHPYQQSGICLSILPISFLTLVQLLLIFSRCPNAATVCFGNCAWGSI